MLKNTGIQSMKKLVSKIKQKLNKSSKASLNQWILMSFLIISLPLIFAIIYVLIAMNNYSKETHKTVFQTVIITENSRLMLEHLISMERSIRQYQVLKEVSFLETYLTHHQALVQLMGRLNLTKTNIILTQKIQSLKQQENNLFQAINQRAFVENHALTKQELNQFAKMNLSTRQLIKLGSQQQIKDMQYLTEYEQNIQKQMFYIMLSSGILAILLSIFFVRFITLPIKRLGLAMRHLIKEDFETNIPYEGPKEVQELGKNLEDLRQELNSLENGKQQFIRNISHELKTPLTTLKEGTNLLAEELLGPLNTDQKEVTELMQMGNFNIINLVENLLEYQKAMSLHSHLEIHHFDITKLLNNLKLTYQLLLQKKSITLMTHTPKLPIQADQDKLYSIISNLLSNAIKFSPKNSNIEITVTVEHNNLIILVEDQGKGISEEIQETIFKAFVQINNPQQLTMKGTGLGLTIVGYYVAQHGGSIKLLKPSNLYNGARFAVTIPME